MASKDVCPFNANELIAAINTYVAAATPAPADYGTTAGKLTAMTAAAGDLQTGVTAQEAALASARAATEDKDAFQAAAAALYREANKTAQATAACTDAMKAAAGLPVYDTGKTPVPAPTLVPVVIIEAVDRLSHTLRIIDPSSPKGGKPSGVAGYNVYYKLGAMPPTSTADCVFAGSTGKSRFVVNYAGGQGNQPVWYIAVPFNAKGQVGPMSETVAATIAA